MRIELAPMDYYFYRPSLYTIQFAFEYSTQVSTERLSDAVKSLAKKMPITGARLVKISHTQLALETGHDIPVREQKLNEPVLKETQHLFDTVTNTGNEPLIQILVSHADKGSYVGFSFSHLLGDGASFFMFMENLCRTIAGREIDPVSVDRSKLSALVQRDDRAGLFDSTGYIRPRPKDPDKVHVENIHYSHTQISDIKNKLKAVGCTVSTNDIIMADLTKRFHRDVPKFEDRLIVRCPVDYRKVVGVGEHYFGNAIRDAVSSFSSEELEEMNIAQIAGRIRQSILAIDVHSVGQSLTALDRLRRRDGIDVFQELGCPGLLVSNLSKLPFSKMDLGSGAPSRLHHASLNPRLALVLPDTDGYAVKFKKPCSHYVTTPTCPQRPLSKPNSTHATAIASATTFRA